MSQEQRADTKQNSCGKVQHDHDIALVETIRDHSAKGGEENGRKKGQSHYSSIERGGSGLLQKIERKSETDSRVAKEGDDLPDDNQCKIMGKEFGSHGETSLFNLHTDRRYVSEENKAAF